MRRQEPLNSHYKCMPCVYKDRRKHDHNGQRNRRQKKRCTLHLEMKHTLYENKSSD